MSFELKKKKTRIELLLLPPLILTAILIWWFQFKNMNSEAELTSKSIAVLPFKNMNAEREFEYFSDGMTEDIITQLSRIDDLKVVSRTSVMRYKNATKSVVEIGRELGVDITLNVREVNAVEEIMALTNGVGADMVVECTGQSTPAAEVLDMIRKNGRISYNGIYHDPVTLQLDKIVQWNLLITGPKAEGRLNLARAIPLMADGRMNLKPLLTHEFSLDEINSAFDTFTGRIGGAIKVIVKP